MKVLVATEKPFAKVAVDGIRKEIEAAGYELALLEKYTDKAQLLDAVKDANAIIIRSDIIDAEVLDAAKELKIVVRAGAGYDNVDLTAATAHNVCVMNTPGQNSNAVAELALGMMVYAVRNFYNGTSGTELMGKKLGIHAYGNVGRNVARVAKGFGMEVYAYDASMSEAFGYAGNVTTNVSVSMDTQFLAHQFRTGSTVIEVTDSIYHHAQSQFGNSIGVLSRSIHHTNIVSGSGSQVYIIISCTGTNYNLQLFSSIQHLCINNITTDNDRISIFHCIQQLCLICIFLQQSKLISGCFNFFTDTVYCNFGKRFFSSYKYFHNLMFCL